MGLRTHCKRGHELSENNIYNSPLGKGRQCRTCVLDCSKKRYRQSDQHKLAQKERSWKWQENNRGWSSFSKLLSKYNLTLDQYHSMYESQDFSCKICKEYMDLVVDHSHTTGEVRGLLCNGCNAGLGFFKENPAALIEAANYVDLK